MSKDLTPLEEALSTRLALMGLDLLCYSTELIKAQDFDLVTRATFTPERLASAIEFVMSQDYKHLTTADQVAVYENALGSFTDYEEQLDEWLEHPLGLAGWWFDEKTQGGEGTVLVQYTLGTSDSNVYGLDIMLYSGEWLEYRSCAPDTFTVRHNNGHEEGKAHVWANHLASVCEQILEGEEGLY